MIVHLWLPHRIGRDGTPHEKKSFRLTKICEKGRKDHICVSFCMFLFHGNIIFSESSFKRKYKKAASFRKCVFSVNMTSSYTMAGCKDEILCRIVTKTSDLLQVFRSTFGWRYLSEKMKFSLALKQKQAISQLFDEDVYIFPISFRKRDRTIADLFFF